MPAGLRRSGPLLRTKSRVDAAVPRDVDGDTATELSHVPYFPFLGKSSKRTAAPDD